MGIERVYAVLAPVACAAVFVACWGVYAVASGEAGQSRAEVVQVVAKGLAGRLAVALERLNTHLDTLAGDRQIIDLLQSGDRQRIDSEAHRLTALLPGSLRVRLLPPTVNQPDSSREPPMGYADLDLVRQALSSPGPVPPMMHGFGSSHSHLAAARRVVAGERVVGAILISWSPDFIERQLAATDASLGAFEVVQGELSLGFHGDPSLRRGAPDAVMEVAGSNWRVNVWAAPPGTQWSRVAWVALIILSAAVGVGVLFFFAHRRFADELSADFAMIEKALPDIMAGRVGGSYPVALEQSRALIARLTRVKGHILPEMGMPRSKTPEKMSGKAGDYRKQEAMLEKELRSPIQFPPSPTATGVEVSIDPSGPSASIFRAYDIRGIVGQTLFPETVYDIGRAVASDALDCDQTTIVVARDGRASSADLSGSLARGIMDGGCDIIDIGRVPTPVLYFATHHLDTQSGVAVTGSHNPPEYNGLKMVIAGETLFGDRIQRLRQRIESGVLRKGEGKREQRNVSTEYIGAVMEDVRIARPMKIVVDCGNGVAGAVAPVLFRTLGCEVIELFCEVDGNFPNHHPDPSKPENLETLMQTVRAEGADLGIAFDGDGDRLGVVDSEGKIIWPDRQMMLFAADVLARHPGADIIYDVKCSRHLGGVILKRGGRPIMFKSGHSLMKAKIRETGAKLAGEMSGHIFFNDRWFGFDDGLYSASRLIEILSVDSRPSREVFKDLPDSVNTPELNVMLDEGEGHQIVQELQATAEFKGAKVTQIDGLRVDFDDGWGLVRASNTTPSLAMRFEADSQAALERIQQQFKKLIKKVKSDIVLPF